MLLAHFRKQFMRFYQVLYLGVKQISIIVWKRRLFILCGICKQRVLGFQEMVQLSHLGEGGNKIWILGPRREVISSSFPTLLQPSLLWDFMPTWSQLWTAIRDRSWPDPTLKEPLPLFVRLDAMPWNTYFQVRTILSALHSSQEAPGPLAEEWAGCKEVLFSMIGPVAPKRLRSRSCCFACVILYSECFASLF